MAVRVWQREVVLLKILGQRKFTSNSETLPNTRYNTLNEDQSIIISYHPRQSMMFHDTKPLWSEYREKKINNPNKLTPEQMEMAKKLRNEDPLVWNVGTLSRLFNVRPKLISHVARLSEENRRDADKRLELIAKLRYHKRVRFLKKEEEERQTRLKNALANLNYKFPGQL
jgi:hypothetical protein